MDRNKKNETLYLFSFTVRENTPKGSPKARSIKRYAIDRFAPVSAEDLRLTIIGKTRNSMIIQANKNTLLTFSFLINKRMKMGRNRASELCIPREAIAKTIPIHFLPIET